MLCGVGWVRIGIKEGGLALVGKHAPQDKEEGRSMLWGGLAGSG